MGRWGGTETAGAEKQQMRNQEVLFPEPPVCLAGLGDGPVFGERVCRLRQEGRAGEGRGDLMKAGLQSSGVRGVGSEGEGHLLRTEKQGRWKGRGGSLGSSSL